MKKTTKVILSSALTMGLCASLIAGSTLAMFSSRSNVNVAITSGKVDVVASVDTDSLKAYSTVWNEGTMQYEEVEQRDDHFHAGGFYSYSAGALTFTNIAAGDAVEFKLNIENKSTLAIQYRVQLTVPTQQENRDPQGDLVKEMQVSFDGGDPVTIGDESTVAQKWSEPVDASAPITTQPTVKISVPAELEGNQGESCLLHVGVYAVQLGTHTANTYGTYNVYTASDFMKLVNGSKSRVSSFKGETIALMNDIDLDPNAEDVSTLSLALADAPMPIATVQSELNWDSEFQGTLDGNGFTISNFKSVEAPMGMGADMPQGFINTTRDATIRNLIISDAAISFNSQNVGTSARNKYNQGGTLVGVAHGTLTVENVVIKNSTVKSTTNYTNKCTGAGGKTVKTKEEAQENNLEWNSKPLVGYDVIGALIGVVHGDTTIKNVKVTLNETSAELTGAEEIKDYNGSVLRTFKGNKLIGEINGSVTYVGNTTLDCISEDGIDESMTFNAETASSGVPTPSVEIGSANGLVALAESIQSGRDFSGTIITLTDNIVLDGKEELTTSGFKGTIDGGAEGHTISGLDLKYFSKVASPVSLMSAEEAPTLKNVTLEFTQFTGVDDWQTSYVHQESADGFMDTSKVNLENVTVALQDDTLRYELGYDGDGNLVAVSYIGLRQGNPETGEDYAPIYDNLHRDIASGSVTYQNVKFTGDSYLNITGGTHDAPVVLNLDHCYVDVDVITKIGNNSRYSFIACATEGAYIKFNLTGNVFLCAQSSRDFYSAAIFSWANTVDGSVFDGNIFGKNTEDNSERYTFVTLKLMNFDVDANVAFTNNTIYGTAQNYYFDAFDLMQNNSRANTYTATFSANKVYALEGTSYGLPRFLWVEANLTSEQNPGHGQVLVTNDNFMYLGEEETKTPLSVEAYDPDTFEWQNVSTEAEKPGKYEVLESEQRDDSVVNRSYQYTFVSWDVLFNAENKVQSGTFVLGAASDAREKLAAFLADDAKITFYQSQTGLTTNAQGAYVVDSVDSLKKLQQYIGQQPDEIVELHIVLEADIDLSDIDSISASWTESKKIKGTIDGNGYAVYGLSEDAKLKTYTNSSIFGNMTADSEIKNISFIYDIFAAENYLTSDAQLIKTELLNGAILHDVLVCVRGTDKKSYWATSYWDNNGSATNSVPGKNTERVEKFLEK